MPEGSRDELSIRTEFVNHISDCFPMLSVQSLIDLIEKVERCRIAFLNGENQRQGN